MQLYSVPDAAFAQRLVEEGALLADDDLLEAHLPLLYLGVLVVDLRPHGLGEARELVVVAYHLELVAGEEGHLAIGDVDALAAAEDAAHVDAEMLAEVELRELLCLTQSESSGTSQRLMWISRSSSRPS